MRFPTGIASLLVAFIGSASASPVTPNHLEKRQDMPDQILYAVNCFDLGCLNTRECREEVSFLVWYKDWRKSQHYEIPDAISREYKDWSDPRWNHNNGNGFPLRWEGIQYNDLIFDSDGARAGIKIEAWGQDVADNTVVGSAWNSYGTHFTCKKDNKRTLFEAFTGSKPYHCNSIYYCGKS